MDTLTATSLHIYVPRQEQMVPNWICAKRHFSSPSAADNAVISTQTQLGLKDKFGVTKCYNILRYCYSVCSLLAKTISTYRSRNQIISWSDREKQMRYLFFSNFNSFGLQTTQALSDTSTVYPQKLKTHYLYTRWPPLPLT